MPLFPVNESLLEECPRVEAISLLESTYPVEDIEGLNICWDGNFVSADATEEWVEAYSAKNANPDAAVDIACAAIAHDPLIVWVDYGTEIIPVYAPQGVCGEPQEAATDVYTDIIGDFEGFLPSDGVTPGVVTE